MEAILTTVNCTQTTTPVPLPEPSDDMIGGKSND
jgi:hypothetical protein